VKPKPKHGRDARWISPDIEKLLKENGVEVESNSTEINDDETLRATLMLAAFLTTLLFAISAVCGYRHRQTGRRHRGETSGASPSPRFFSPSGRSPSATALTARPAGSY